MHHPLSLLVVLFYHQIKGKTTEFEIENALPFAADFRKLYKVGVTFDSGQRLLNGWKVAEQV